MGDLISDALPPVSKTQMIRCIEREIAMRRKVYPRWVEAGRMRQETADEEIRVMEAVREALSDGSQ